MPTPASQRWATLLTLPLIALGALILPLTEATATNVRAASLKVQNAAPKTVLVAQRSRVQRVQFAPGENAATIKTSVVNGTRDIYLLGAQKGQTMQVKLASVESNAVFDIVTPVNRVGRGRTLKQEAVTWSGTLPETGDYQIVVGSIRGNASYRLQITIR